LPIFFFFLFSLWQERSGGDRYGRATKSGSNVIDKRFHATNATAIALSQSSTVAFASLTNIRPTAYITSPNTHNTHSYKTAIGTTPTYTHKHTLMHCNRHAKIGDALKRSKPFNCQWRKLESLAGDMGHKAWGMGHGAGGNNTGPGPWLSDNRSVWFVKARHDLSGPWASSHSNNFPRHCWAQTLPLAKICDVCSFHYETGNYARRGRI